MRESRWSWGGYAMGTPRRSGWPWRVAGAGAAKGRKIGDRHLATEQHVARSQSPFSGRPFYEQRSRVKPISACAQVQRRDGSSFYCGSYSADHGFGGNGGIFYTSGVKPRWAVDARHAISVRCCWTFDSRAFLISSDRRRSQRFFCAADPNQLSRYTSMLIHAIPRHMEACCGGGMFRRRLGKRGSAPCGRGTIVLEFPGAATGGTGPA